MIGQFSPECHDYNFSKKEYPVVDISLQLLGTVRFTIYEDFDTFVRYKNTSKGPVGQILSFIQASINFL